MEVNLNLLLCLQDMNSEKIILYKILTHHLAYLDVDGRVLLKCILKSVRT